MFNLIDLAWALPQLTEQSLFVEIVRHNALVLLILVSIKLHHVLLTYLFSQHDSSCANCDKSKSKPKAYKASRKRRR